MRAAEEQIATQALAEKGSPPGSRSAQIGTRGCRSFASGLPKNIIVRHWQSASMKRGVGKGSGRSIAGLSLVEALRNCADLLEKFGGHEMAAGLTMREENFAALRQAFRQRCGELLTAEQLEPRLHLDEELPLGEVTWELMRWHELLQPSARESPAALLARAVEPVAPPQIVKKSI